MEKCNVAVSWVIVQILWNIVFEIRVSSLSYEWNGIKELNKRLRNEALIN
jgi:hypothetical protein